MIYLKWCHTTLTGEYNEKAFSMDLKEEQILKSVDRFVAYNESRMARLLELMPIKKRAVFRTLPFLLQINHKDFPGYISHKMAPGGIFGWSMNNACLESLKKIFPQADLGEDMDSFMPTNASIKSLLLMGSVGSVAQSPKSDFDFWVCIQKDKLNSMQYSLLEKKLLTIEEWADEKYELELHFFVTDIAMVKNNDFGSADKESAGTSQAKILKEEFYRTSVLVMGKIPFWWITPPTATASKYEELKQFVTKSQEIQSSLFIDLGNLSEISNEEFFGAAIWQICKAMDSPYKSVLKMALLQVFLDPKKKNQLLCNIIKRRVQEGHLDPQKDIRQLDPYAVMFDTILEYYSEIDKDILDLFATCLYIKSTLKIDQDFRKKERLNFKESLILDYINEWKWPQEKISDLNNYKEWNFQKVCVLGQEVHKFLIKAYQKLSEHLKSDQNNQLISKEDITIIGRKLDSFYSQKPLKVPYLKRAFETGLLQESVTISADFNKPKQQTWTLLRGQLSRGDIQHKDIRSHVLKQSDNIVESLIWAIHNRMIDHNTSVYLLPNPSPITMTDIQDLINSIFSCFPTLKLSEISNQDLLGPQYHVKTLFILNFGSNRTIPHIATFTLTFKTNWGELYMESSQQNTNQRILEYLKTHPSKPPALTSDYELFIPKSPSQRKIRDFFEQKIEKLVAKKKIAIGS